MRIGVLAVAMLATAPLAAQSGRGDHWVGTWATAVVARPVAAGPARQGGPPGPPPLVIDNQTLREIVHTTLAGSRVRVVFSNAFGTAPVDIGAAHVALRDKESAIVASSDRALTFGGRPAFRIPPGASAVSDPVSLSVPQAADLAIDLYLPGQVGSGPSPLTMHGGANQTIYISGTGNHAGEPSLQEATPNRSWYLLSSVEVIAPERTNAIVTFGDSITDGTRSTIDTNSRWPDELARRLAADRGNRRFAVLNEGIAGNQVVGNGFPGAGVNALARFDRDVLAQPGVTHVIVMEGINDIGLARANPTPSAADLIAAHEQLIARAHAHGLKIYGATLTPFEGASYFSPEGEMKREAVNEWIRTSGAYDGVVDFDKVIRDPGAPTKFLPQYDSGDHLHPNDAGYKAMGDAVDLGLFK
jgi:lysophospholipase L1-like esterase